MINEVYLGDEVKEQMAESFSASGDMIVLKDFLDSESYEKIRKILVSGEGRKEKIPDKYSFDLINAEDLGLENVLKDFISGVVGKSFDNIDLKVKKFGHRDYTLMHDEDSEKLSSLIDKEGSDGEKLPLSTENGENDRYEFFFFVCDGWAEQWGGYKVYTLEDSEPLLFFPEENSFCLINKKNMNSFVKYVNNLAGENSYFLIEGVVS